MSKQTCGAIISSKKQTIEFVFLSWQLRNTWNLKLKFKLQVFPSCQDRKTNLFLHSLGEAMARQFCFEIYWPLVTDSDKVGIQSQNLTKMNLTVCNSTA